MTLSRKTGIILAVAFVLCVGMLLGLATVAKANPSIFATGSATSAATSSPRFMTAGVSTSTVYFDAQDQTFSGGQTFKADQGALFVQLTPSSSALTKLNIAFEYAYYDGTYDCNATPTACDWYKFYPQDGTASSTVALGNPYSINLNSASSTLGGATSTTNRGTSVIPVNPLARYVRAVATVSGANGALWMYFLPTQQVK